MFTFVSCATQGNMNVGSRQYSTGHLGMPGEYRFEFRDNRYFQFYQSVPGFYSEGEIKWIDKNYFELSSKETSVFDSIPNTLFRDLTGEKVKITRGKLYFDRIFFFRVENNVNDR